MKREEHEALLRRLMGVNAALLAWRNAGFDAPRFEEISKLCIIIADLIDIVARCTPAELP